MEKHVEDECVIAAQLLPIFRRGSSLFVNRVRTEQTELGDDTDELASNVEFLEDWGVTSLTCHGVGSGNPSVSFEILPLKPESAEFKAQPDKRCSSSDDLSQIFLCLICSIRDMSLIPDKQVPRFTSIRDFCNHIIVKHEIPVNITSEQLLSSACLIIVPFCSRGGSSATIFNSDDAKASILMLRPMNEASTRKRDPIVTPKSGVSSEVSLDFVTKRIERTEIGVPKSDSPDIRPGSSTIICKPEQVEDVIKRDSHLLNPKPEAQEGDFKLTDSQNSVIDSRSQQLDQISTLADTGPLQVNESQFASQLRESFNPAISLMMASKQSISNFLQNSLNIHSTSSSFDALLNPSTSSSIVGHVQQNQSQLQRCALHPDGKGAGVECPKCDLVLGSSRSLGGHITMMHSRNSCKTLKCPKCNWHYKYQETLEIHMNEKHNDTVPTACVYCASNAPHPRLGRGEQWSCGYKPYRCEVCKYSTTTKGNLAIHMQSDKHLNNVQEIQQSSTGSLLCPITFTPILGTSASPTSHSNPKNSSPLPHGTTSSAMALLQLAQSCITSQSDQRSPDTTVLNLTSENRRNESSPLSNDAKDNFCGNNRSSRPFARGCTLSGVSASDSPSSNALAPYCGRIPSTKPKSIWRCDVCNYETNVARNLRIHMTSEKHTQNMQSVQNGANAALGLITNPVTLHTRTNDVTPPSVCQTSGQSLASGSKQGSSAAEKTSNADKQTASSEDDQHKSAQLAASMQSYLLEQGANSGRLFQCCVCMSFACDSLAELIEHQQRADRARSNESDVALLNGNYLCNLCHYKTHLKANFQLHTKTDKHLQRLQLVNHVREGGFRNELRVKYLNPNNSIQLRCIPCNEFSNSLHKLQMHLATSRHKIYQTSYEKICSTTSEVDAACLGSNRCLYCALCDYFAIDRQSMIAHLHSERHADMLAQVLVMTETQDGDLDGFNMNWIEVRDNAEKLLFDDDSEDDAIDTEFLTKGLSVHDHSQERNISPNDDQELNSSSMKVEKREVDRSAVQCDIGCDRDTLDEKSKRQADVLKCNAVTHSFVCPLCQTDCGPRSDQLESHLSQMHKVPADGVRRLLELLPQPSIAATTKVIKKECADSLDDDAAVASAPFSCWSRDCVATFASLAALHAHQRLSHSVSSTAAIESSSRASKQTSNASLASQRCDACGRLFRTRASLARHVDKTHASSSLTLQLLSSAATANGGAAVASETLVNGTSGSLVDDGEERLNTALMAELHYADPSRIFRCDRCKMAFTKQVFLSVHNRTLQHRQRQQQVGSTCSNQQQQQQTLVHRPQYSSVCNTNSGNNNIGAIGCATISNPLVGVMEKYHDPLRPHKCDVCKESFTQKNILLVHYNSVSHLNKLKKTATTSSSSSSPKSVTAGNSFTPPTITKTVDAGVNNDLNSNADASGGAESNKESIDSPCEVSRSTDSSTPIDGSVVKSATPETLKLYKCNVCKVSYGSGTTLDVHLRSLVHQTRFQKLLELYASGEMKHNVQLIERPDVKYARNGAVADAQAPVKTLRTPNLSAEATAKTISFVNENSETNKIFVDSETDSMSPNVLSVQMAHYSSKHCSKGSILKKLLENYGFEVVMQYNEGHNRKRRKSTSDIDEQNNKDDDEEMRGGGSESELKKIKLEKVKQKSPGESQKPSSSFNIPEVGKCKCSSCEKEFSSLWVLKAHVEQVHKQIVPAGEVEKVSETFKQALDNKCLGSAIKAENGDSVQMPGGSTNPSTPGTPSLVAAATSGQKSQANEIIFNNNLASTISQTSQNQAAAMAAAAVNMSLANLGLQYPFMGLPFSPFAIQNPFLPVMMPQAALFDPANFGQNAGTQVTAHFNSSIPSCSQKTTSTPPVSANPAVTSGTRTAINLQTMTVAQQQSDQPKRARTRITDDQLNVLRLYFDINNSPTEEQIDEMSRKAGLPHKVIKHWFRNTLFKERQRSKDSPYNFNIPPSMGIDLEEYEKTGEARIIVIDDKSVAAGVIIKSSNEEKDRESASVLSVNSLTDAAGSQYTDEKSYEKIDGAVNENEQTVPSGSDSKPDESNMEDVNEEDYENIAVEGSENKDQELVKPEEQLRQLAATASDLPMISVHLNNMATVSINNGHQTSPNAHTSQKTIITPQTLLSPLVTPSSSIVDYGNSLSLNLSPNAATSANFSTLAAYASASSVYGSQSLPFGSGSIFAPSFPGSISTGHSHSQSSASGRRANRTRFTEWQVKILQEFFETNAYPKDDDLECLSSRLSLSPRVIVVWFQNMRQKARKIYENNPTNTPFVPQSVESSQDDQFVKTPGLNYQCKKCCLVFQRYYELIKHQKCVCFKDDAAFNAKLAAFTSQSKQNGDKAPFDLTCRNDSLEEGALRIDEKRQEDAQSDAMLKWQKMSASSLKASQIDHSSANAQLMHNQLELFGKTVCKQYNAFKAAPASGSIESSKSSDQQIQETFGSKRCPFCTLLMPNKQFFDAHTASKHSDQYSNANTKNITWDDLPEISGAGTFNLADVATNSKISLASNVRHFLNGVMCSSANRQAIESSPNFDEAPLDLSRATPSKQQIMPKIVCGSSNEELHRAHSENNSCNDDDVSFNSFENASFCADDETPPPSPSSNGAKLRPPPSSSSGGQWAPLPSTLAQRSTSSTGQRPHKRFRTRLTPQQIRVMKCLFKDFKTPTMSECEALGNEMNLHKRVVQVWFQNARAKERKSRTGSSQSVNDDITCSTSRDRKNTPSKCDLCNVPVSGRVNLQDHAFTKPHIENVRRLVEFACGDDDSGNVSGDDAPPSPTPSSARSTTNASGCASADDNRRLSFENCLLTPKSAATADVATTTTTAPSSDVAEATKPKALNSRLMSSSESIGGRAAYDAASSADVGDAAAAALPPPTSNFLPYVYAAAAAAAAASNPMAAFYASMMLPAATGLNGLPNANLFYDPNLHGTPVNLLQVPHSVMQTIVSTMQRNNEQFCRFTQDGKNLDELIKNSSDPSIKLCAGEKDLEVGWACRACNAVFQAGNLFTNHQHLICQSKERAFKLIQIHYECKWCKQYYGTQAEFLTHCELSEHKSKCS